MVDQVVDTSSEAESESELDLSYDNAIEDLKGQVNRQLLTNFFQKYFKNIVNHDIIRFI